MHRSFASPFIDYRHFVGLSLFRRQLTDKCGKASFEAEAEHENRAMRKGFKAHCAKAEAARVVDDASRSMDVGWV